MIIVLQTIIILYVKWIVNKAKYDIMFLPMWQFFKIDIFLKILTMLLYTYPTGNVS